MNPVDDYVEALVHALLVVEREHRGYRSIPDHLAVTAAIRDRFVPMILEWSQLPFLPPPTLLVLFDSFMLRGDGEPFHRGCREAAAFFSHGLRDAEGVPLFLSVHHELEGSVYSAVQQATRARALAIACPTPTLEGSYTGRVSDVRKKLNNADEIRMWYATCSRELGADDQVSRLFQDLDTGWLARQVETWPTKDVRKYLSGRLRPRDSKGEMIRAGAQSAAQSLIDTLKAFVDTAGEKLETLDALFEFLRSRPSGDVMEAVLRRVLPIVALEEPARATQEMPSGGYADIATRGSFDRLLISNLSYPEEEFARRLVEGELLFYELETPPAQKPPKQFVFLDASPATWGIPRFAGSAVALGVVNRARERRAEVQVHAAGKRGRPFDHVDQVWGVNAILEHARWEPDLARELATLAETIRAEIKGHPTGADLFVCTEAARLPELLEWTGTSGLPPGVRLAVFATDQFDGRATLWRLEGGAFDPVASLSLAVDDLVPNRAPAPAVTPAGSLLPRHLQVEWDWGSNVTCAAIRADGLAVTGHENGEIHLWDSIAARHIEHRTTLADPAVAIAISGNDIVVATLKEDRQKHPNPAFSWMPVAGDESSLPIACAVDPKSLITIKPGWEPRQFFWWENDKVLLEYRADTHKVERHAGCLKSSRQSFLVRPVEKIVVWRNNSGRIGSYGDALTQPEIPPRVREALSTEMRHLVFDDEGSLAVRMSRTSKTADLLWLEPRASEKFGDIRIPGGQHPKAVSAAADRLISTNSNSIWFFQASAGKLVKQSVGHDDPLLRVKCGRTGTSAALNAVVLEFNSGRYLMLSWHPEDASAAAIQCETVYRAEGGKHYVGKGDKTRTFMEYSSHARTASPIRFGELWVEVVSNRKIVLSRRDTVRAAVQFWFSMRGDWILASSDFVAGNDVHALVKPEGRDLVLDPVRLARILQNGVKGRGA